MNEFNSIVEAFALEGRESIEFFALMTQARMLSLDNFAADHPYKKIVIQTQVYKKVESDYKFAMRLLEAREFHELLPPHLR